MNPIAATLNETLTRANRHVFEMLSSIGEQLFFPKGILTQSAEAKQKAHRTNATAGIATEKGEIMRLETVAAYVHHMPMAEALNYAPSFGILPLREHWKKELYQKNASLAGKTISLPVVTNGITHGVSTTADLWVDPGDVVVVPEMMWGNYNMIFRVKHGARFVTYPMFDDQGGFDVAGFGAAIDEAAQGQAKIMVILNFPHNPSGYSVSGHEGREIVRILADKAAAGVNVIAVCDDAYFGLFYEPQTLKESLFALLSDRHERLLAVKLDGATKENYVWGLRVGFVTYGAKLVGEAAPFYEALEKKTAGCIRGTISNASHIGQSIVLKSMQDPQYKTQKAAKFEIMRRRAERVKAVLTDPKYEGAWQPYPFNSGYFMCLRLKTVAAEPLRVHLLDKYGVGLISLGETDLRVAFSCLESEQAAELFDTILQGIEDLQS